MPIGAILPALAAIGGGSAVAGGLLAAGTVATVAGAFADRQSVEEVNTLAQENRDASQAFIEESVAQARTDLFKLFPQAQETRRIGTQTGLDIFSESIPAQIDLFRSGNVAAQNQLIQGLPQFQNAILGVPGAGITGFQPTSIRPGAGGLGAGVRSTIAGLQLPPVPTQLP